MKGPVRFGAFEWNPVSCSLRKHGVLIGVPKQSLVILAALLERPGEIVTREHLQEQLWPDGTIVEFEHSISAAMNRLRTALDDSAAKPRFIETLPGKGYRFLASIETAIPDPPQTATAPPVCLGRTSWLVGSALLASCLAAVALTFVAARPTASDATRPFTSIAVLPLANLSGDPDQEYFADGITEELISQLCQLRSLQVVSRTSVMRFKGRSGPVRAIAKDLGVDAVLEGSVQRSGGRVRVTAQLINAATDRHVWSRTYDRDAADVLRVRDDVARAVAEQFQVALTPEIQAQFGIPSRVSAEGYEAFLKGTYFANRSNLRGQRKAVEYFEEAVRHDPEFARAWAALSHAIGYLDFFDDVPASERCVFAMKRALELDPTLAESHINFADLKFYWDWDWTQGEAAYRRTVQMNPNSPAALDHYALALRALGRACEAVVPAERALHLDPLSPSMNVEAGYALLGCGRRESALEKFKTAVALDPSYQPAYTALAEAWEQLHRPDEAVAAYLQRERIAGRGDQVRRALEVAYRVGGLSGFKRRLAQERLSSLRQESSKRRVSPRAFAETYAAMDESSEAMRWLEEAFRQRCPTLALLKAAPKWAPLRGDPRFKDLLRRLSLQ